MGAVVGVMTVEQIADFWTQVDQSGGPSACWPWMGPRLQSGGYGRYRRGGLDLRANRVALALTLGRDLAAGMGALHECDNPPCCNPAHLTEGDQSRNMADAFARGRVEPPRGQHRGFSHHETRMTPEALADIRASLDAGESLTSIGERHGMARQSIAQIRDGVTWKEAS